jgi:hypothetical protein
MRSRLHGQSRKTDRFIEQSFKGLTSAWATGVFAGINLTARLEAGACPLTKSAHLLMSWHAEAKIFNAPESSQATVHGSCIAICVVFK